MLLIFGQASGPFFKLFKASKAAFKAGKAWLVQGNPPAINLQGSGNYHLTKLRCLKCFCPFYKASFWLQHDTANLKAKRSRKLHHTVIQLCLVQVSLALLLHCARCFCLSQLTGRTRQRAMDHQDLARHVVHKLMPRSTIWQGKISLKIIRFDFPAC